MVGTDSDKIVIIVQIYVAVPSGMTVEAIGTILSHEKVFQVS